MFEKSYELLLGNSRVVVVVIVAAGVVVVVVVFSVSVRALLPKLHN